jgi:uncharacterized protein (PEP-CTERM system associated)
MRICFRAIWIAAVAILATSAPTVGEFSLTPWLSISETYTDNVDLEPDDKKDSALITQVTPGLSLAVDTPRVTANANTAVNFRYQALTNEETDFFVDANGFANLEILEELFFLDLRASVTQQVVDSQDATSASSANTTNLDTTQIYDASPYLVQRFGDFADSELRYTFSYVDVGSDSVSNSLQHQVVLGVDSGSDFTKVLWSVDGYALHNDRSQANNIDRASAELKLAYVVAEPFALLAGGGYNTFDDGISENEVDEPLWQAGFLLTAEPRGELRFTYGRRDGFDSPTVSLRYEIGPRTRLTAEYAEVLETAQGRLALGLTSIGVDENGNLINLGREQPFNPNTSSTSLQDDTTRNKNFFASVIHEYGRNTFNATAFYEDEKTLNTNESEEILGFSGNWFRLITPELDFRLFGSYQHSDFDETPNREDDQYTALLGLNYSILDYAATFATYTFRF